MGAKGGGSLPGFTEPQKQQFRQQQIASASIYQKQNQGREFEASDSYSGFTTGQASPTPTDKQVVSESKRIGGNYKGDPRRGAPYKSSSKKSSSKKSSKGSSGIRSTPRVDAHTSVSGTDKLAEKDKQTLGAAASKAAAGIAAKKKKIAAGQDVVKTGAGGKKTTSLLGDNKFDLLSD